MMESKDTSRSKPIGGISESAKSLLYSGVHTDVSQTIDHRELNKDLPPSPEGSYVTLTENKIKELFVRTKYQSKNNVPSYRSETSELFSPNVLVEAKFISP